MCYLRASCSEIAEAFMEKSGEHPLSKNLTAQVFADFDLPKAG